MFVDERGLLQGTLELLILKTLSWGPAHGYGIASWIEQATGDALRVEEGSLYPALHRLERKGWVAAVWGVSENNRKAKFYRLTREGRTQFRAKARGWDRLVAVVGMALAAPARPGVREVT
jgi:transcriptional regulator